MDAAFSRGLMSGLLGAAAAHGDLEAVLAYSQELRQEPGFQETCQLIKETSPNWIPDLDLIEEEPE